jgi:hypothetical protein
VEQRIHFLAVDLPHSDACFVRAYPNTVHFAILIAAVKSVRTVGSGVRGRSG